jgi:hypothetical protein
MGRHEPARPGGVPSCWRLAGGGELCERVRMRVAQYMIGHGCADGVCYMRRLSAADPPQTASGLKLLRIGRVREDGDYRA